MRFFAPAMLFACTALIAVSPAHARPAKQTAAISQNEKLLMDRAEGRSEARISVAPEASKKRTRTSRAERHAKKRSVSVKHSDVSKSVKVSSSRSSARKAPSAGSAGLRAKVQHYAAQQGVPADLAHGVVMVESRYNPKATGPGGYIGLMQLSYRTAQGMGYKGSRAALYDPDTNLHYGMKYLAGAYQKSGGSMCGAVSKYQGGHGVKGVTRAGSVYCTKVRGHIANLNRGTDVKLASN